MAKFDLSTNYFCFNFYFHLSAATVTSKFNHGQRNSMGVITNQSFNQGQRNWHKSVKHYGGWHHPKFERLSEITNSDKERKQTKKRKKKKKQENWHNVHFYKKYKKSRYGFWSSQPTQYPLSSIFCHFWRGPKTILQYSLFLYTWMGIRWKLTKSTDREILHNSDLIWACTA